MLKQFHVFLILSSSFLTRLNHKYGFQQLIISNPFHFAILQMLLNYRQQNSALPVQMLQMME